MSLKKDCVYRHLKPNGEVFYIGIGSNLKRPYNKKNRSVYWKNKVKKYPDYEVQILTTGLTKEEACEIETVLISWYKREDCCGGTLVNLTDGGESTYGRIMEDWQRKKMSEDFKGKFIGEDNPNYGNYWSDDKKKNMSHLKKKQYRNGEIIVNYEAMKKGNETRFSKWDENSQLKKEMIKKVSEKNNIYEYLKLSLDGEILEVYQSRLEVIEAYPEAGKTIILSVCNGYKKTYKGFLWRYRKREFGEIMEPIPKWNKGLREKLNNS